MPEQHEAKLEVSSEIQLMKEDLFLLMSILNRAGC